MRQIGPGELGNQAKFSVELEDENRRVKMRFRDGHEPDRLFVETRARRGLFQPAFYFENELQRRGTKRRAHGALIADADGDTDIPAREGRWRDIGRVALDDQFFHRDAANCLLVRDLAGAADAFLGSAGKLYIARGRIIERGRVGFEGGQAIGRVGISAAEIRFVGLDELAVAGHFLDLEMDRPGSEPAKRVANHSRPSAQRAVSIALPGPLPAATLRVPVSLAGDVEASGGNRSTALLTPRLLGEWGATGPPNFYPVTPGCSQGVNTLISI